MGSITVRRDDVTLDEPFLVEGLPGVGLVGKIAVDHIVDEFDMTYYASVDCEGLPPVAIYREGERSVQPPVRLYADSDRDLVALQSDIPVSPSRAPDFADHITTWVETNDATPLYLSGYASEKQADSIPAISGVATGEGRQLLDGIGVDAPSETGVVSGPTGALLHRAGERDIDSIGLIVESDPRFPDPEAARILLEHGIGPLAGIDIDTSSLVEQAEEIRDQKEQLATQMQQADPDESSEAQPLRMYQ